MKTLKNFSPKILWGDYSLLIHEKEMVMVNNKTGETVNTRCHPNDEFNICIGINLLMRRMQNKLCAIKIGDKVKIINNNHCFTRYNNWIKNHVNNLDRAICYSFSNVPANESICTVVAKNLHDYDKSVMLYYIQAEDGACYLVSESGIEKIKERG